MNRTLRIRIFSVLFITIFSAMLGLGVILPILPLYAKNLGATGLWLGAIFVGFSISRSVLVPFIGSYSDKSGIRKAFIAAGLFVYACSALVIFILQMFFHFYSSGLFGAPVLP